jgi:hypothetical protein
MSSTLTPTTFRVQIIEEQIVRNNTIRNEITYTIPNVINTDRRIITCPNTTSVDIFNLNGLVPGPGTFPSSSFKYARISNLDDTYSVAIITNGATDTHTQKLPPTSSIFLASSQITGSTFDGTFGDDVVRIQAFAISGSVNIDCTIINA